MQLSVWDWSAFLIRKEAQRVIRRLGGTGRSRPTNAFLQKEIESRACNGKREIFASFAEPPRGECIVRVSVSSHNYYYLTVFVIGRKLEADREHFLCWAPPFLAWPQKRAHQSKPQIRTLILFYRKHTGLLFRGASAADARRLARLFARRKCWLNAASSFWLLINNAHRICFIHIEWATRSPHLIETRHARARAPSTGVLKWLARVLWR